MKKILVLGAGMVGRTIAIELSKAVTKGKHLFDVASADLSKDSQAKLKEHGKVKTILLDFADHAAIKKTVAPYDLIVGAVPGFLGFKMLDAVIDAGKDIVDISFFPEDPLLLDKKAKKNKVRAIVDCGVAPGMDNIILGYYYARMEVSRFVCLVGGLPVERNFPWQYKAPFSPVDVIEEYTRPARLVENGKIVTRPALTESEYLNFENVGTLEAFNTDGLRTLLNLKIPDMAEKTLRYPGHIELMKVLRHAGFFSTDEIDVKGKKVRPLDVSSKILFPQWKYEKGEEDFTVMRVIVEGKEGKKNKRYTYDLFDRYDKTSHTSSMARTTGYTATAAVNLLASKKEIETGIITPEMLGEEHLIYFLDYLKERNVIYRCKEEIL